MSAFVEENRQGIRASSFDFGRSKVRAALTSRAKRNGAETVNRAWAEAFAIRRKRKPSEWATERRRMPIGGPISGGHVVRYDHRYMPHCVEQMDAADDPSVKMIVIWEGIRDGKTNGVCLNILGRTVDDAPCGIYSVHPTDSDVSKFSEDDIEPMIELSLADKFVAKKSRDSGRTVDFKKFAGGSLRIVSAGSLTKFRGSTVGVLFLHEADALVLESIYKALGRTQGLANAVIVMESTGTLAPTTDLGGNIVHRSVIAEHYEKGDKRKWFCACARCGEMQWLKYRQIKAPTGQFQLATYHCEFCGFEHTEKQWRKMAASGLWYPTAGLSEDDQKKIRESHRDARPKQPEIRSYWRNGFASLLPTAKGYKTKLHQFLAEGEAAKSSTEALKTWTNEIAAELWNPDLELEPPPDWRPLFDRREDYATEKEIILPEKCMVITAGGDVHPNRIEITWLGHGKNDERWVLDHVVIDGDTHKREVWDAATRELQRKFRHTSGAEIGLSFALFDAGYGAEDLYRWLQTIPVAGKIRACRGASKFPHPLIDNRWRTLSGNLKGHWIGGDVTKDIIYGCLRLVIREDGELPQGWIHFGERLGEIYFEQLTAERVTVEEGARRYFNEDRARNETLDCFVYALAAFKRRIWNFDAIEKELAAQTKKPEEPKTSVPAPMRRSPFNSGWTL